MIADREYRVHTLGGYTMKLSQHAEARSKSRNIEYFSLMLIKRFGHSTKSRDDSEIWIANKRARRDILRLIKAMQRDFERSAPPYFVEASDGTVITTGRRTRRIRRK